MVEDIDEIRMRKLNEMLKKIKEKKDTENFPDTPLVLTDGTFDETINKYNVVVVDCWAEWCMPCRMIAPIIEQLAKEMKGKVVFGKLNVDENMEVPSRYYISAIPTLLIFKGGKLVDKVVGALPKVYLERKISQYL